MQKIVLSLLVACSVAGCATVPEPVSRSPRQAVVLVQPAVRQMQPVRASAPVVVPANPTEASLKPGPTYVASFPEADRRAACLRLDYQEGTRKFARCLEGDFPENPYFAQQ